ncbi:PGN_0703 family putative restriction endonuclease [Pseudonocardia oceani]|uniref:PGN_0703 family putative restriction endonuclease n=1 Tax=Pseudonocardia oceani TaxID=2792013 RepID=UPI0035588925
MLTYAWRATWADGGESGCRARKFGTTCQQFVDQLVDRDQLPTPAACSACGRAGLRSTTAVIARPVLEAHHAYVRGDNAWQQRARLHQSLWRQAHGLVAGMHDGKPLGSRLAPADAEPPTLPNYLSPQAQHCVEAAVAEAPKTGALLGRPRLWVDLLSSQPLCFNLFGPLAEDHTLAGRVLSRLWPEIRSRRALRPTGAPKQP